MLDDEMFDSVIKKYKAQIAELKKKAYTNAIAEAEKKSSPSCDPSNSAPQQSVSLDIETSMLHEDDLIAEKFYSTAFSEAAKWIEKQKQFMAQSPEKASAAPSPEKVTTVVWDQDKDTNACITSAEIQEHLNSQPIPYPGKKYYFSSQGSSNFLGQIPSAPLIPLQQAPSEGASYGLTINLPNAVPSPIQENTMWTLDQGLSVVRDLQPNVKKLGYHLCLGGGVLNNGESTKDIDLYFLPLDNAEYPVDSEGLLNMLQNRYLTKIEPLGKPYNDQYEIPYIFKGKFFWNFYDGVQTKNLRFDIFIMGSEKDREGIRFFMSHGMDGEPITLEEDKITHFGPEEKKPIYSDDDIPF
ncbi:MAG: hypothetical protein AB7J46_06665 [Candidatus Altimarinota bacterium]